jgi:hypothetical protein
MTAKKAEPNIDGPQELLLCGRGLTSGMAILNKSDKKDKNVEAKTPAL